MTRPLIDSTKLARALKDQISKQKLTYAEVATASKADASRISKFCDGNFKRLSPVLMRVCEALKTNPEKFLVDGAKPVPRDLHTQVNRFINGSADRARALQKLLRILAKL